VPHVGFVAGAREVIRSQHRREIDESAWHRGDRDAAPSGDISAGETRLAHLDALGTPLRAGGHLRWRGGALEDPQQVPRRAAAQHGSFTTGQHRGEVARLDARRAMSDPVDTAMHAQERAATQPLLDLLAGNACLEELRARHNSMRFSGHPGQLPLHRRQFRLHSNQKRRRHRD
jgi:hypothetical protein